jgi:chromosome transmission fidelity protein 8
MPSIPIHPPSGFVMDPKASNPLPQLLQTPSGLALIELQGTIHVPTPTTEEMEVDNAEYKIDTPVGRLLFPQYSATNPTSDTSWMKRVHLYIGKNQRMTGEVKKLPKPMGILRKKAGLDNGQEELEIVEIVRHKIVFSNRPEPVTESS